MRSSYGLMVALAAAGLAACASMGGADAGPAAQAKLEATKGNSVSGTVTFTQSGDKVMVVANVTGLKPNGEHGFHVHEKGDCSSPDFKSAGDHFNPTSQQHGDPATPPHHLGDIPNLEADDMGKAPVNARIEGVTLGDGSPNDLVGRALVAVDSVPP